MQRKTWKLLAMALALWVLGLGARDTGAAVIFVTSLEQKVESINEHGGCSLQEAIFSANFDDNIAIASYAYPSGDATFVRTDCAKGFGDDVIVLPTKGVLELKDIQDDAYNPLGPTATPIITSNIVIEAHGATLQFAPDTDFGHLFHPENIPKSFRAFAVGSTGHLTIRNATIRGFVIHGGNGGYISDAAYGGTGYNEDGGAGGMGAGGAIYVYAGGLVVEGTTFVGNGAIGGDGAGGAGHVGGGGGGGLGGWGGPQSCDDDGGGGGGSRGYGVGSCAGDGGGTLFDANNGQPGYACGGYSGWRGNPEGGAVDDGEDAPCAGGGGGGGGASELSSYNGGKGNYGGGGGGGGEGANGGDGGFGGGGGAGDAGDLFGSDGGNGGFGGGGGAGPNSTLSNGDPGEGGMFGGHGSHTGGGGGAGLGGAIFNHAGSVVVRNSTFTGNFVTRGLGGGAGSEGAAANGADAGGAIFSVDGHLSVQHCTIAGNEATGAGGGIVVVRVGADTSFTLLNTIIAHNGAVECSIMGDGVATDLRGNLIEANDNCGAPVSSSDPQLGSLLGNFGPTPTMALSSGSPAVDAGDPDVGLPTDQRGQARPVTAFDIGAYELCLTSEGKTCLIPSGLGESDPTLTMLVSPEGAGSTTPPVGTTKVAMNSVIILTAAAATGHQFLDWTGDVTDPTAGTTTIIMTEDETATANFTLLPDFSFSPISPLSLVVGGSGSRTVTVNANATFDQTVSLTKSGYPIGSTLTFHPTSVTPALGGSASSELSVVLGPSVVPGSYSVNVAGSSGSLVHSTPLALTVVASPAGVSQVITTIADLGCIDSAGVVNAFKAKLAQAQAAIDAGDYQTAINLLTALLQQLQAQAGKHLKTECTDAYGNPFDPVRTLIEQVTAILTALGVNLRANPVMGSLVNSSNAEVAGAMITILTGSKTVLSAATDPTGFYVFPKVGALKLGIDYTIKVSLPKGYKLSIPSSQTFKWNATMVTLPRFVIK